MLSKSGIIVGYERFVVICWVLIPCVIERWIRRFRGQWMRLYTYANGSNDNAREGMCYLRSFTTLAVGIGTNNINELTVTRVLPVEVTATRTAISCIERICSAVFFRWALELHDPLVCSPHKHLTGESSATGWQSRIRKYNVSQYHPAKKRQTYVRVVEPSILRRTVDSDEVGIDLILAQQQGGCCFLLHGIGDKLHIDGFVMVAKELPRSFSACEHVIHLRDISWGGSQSLWHLALLKESSGIVRSNDSKSASCFMVATV